MFKKATHQLLKKAGVVFMFRIAGMVISYLAILFISNYYGAEVYGRFSLAQTLLQFSVVIFSLGIETLGVKLTADLRFFSEGKPLNNYLANSLWVLLLSAIFGAVLFWVFKKPLAVMVFKDEGLLPYFNYLAIFFVTLIFHNYFSEFLRGKHQFLRYGLFKYFLPPFIFLILMWVFQETTFSESGIFLSYILGFGLLVVPLLFIFPFKHLKTEVPYSKGMLLRASYPMMFSAAFMFLSNWTDVFMLGAMVSKQEVGIYNAAYKLAILALIVINAVNTILAPKISQLYSANKLKAVQAEVQHATKLITYLTAPIVLVLIVFREPLLELFGAGFSEGKTALVIIAVGLLFNALSGSVGQVLNMTQHQEALKKYTIVSVVVNIVLNFILIKQMGFVGAAYASLVSNVVLNTLCLYRIKKEFGFYAFFKPWK